MERINVAVAGQHLSNLVNRVYAEGISVELEEGNEVKACLTPAKARSYLKVRDLNIFLQSLPKLGDDAKAFSDEVRSSRRAFPPETNPWD